MKLPKFNSYRGGSLKGTYALTRKLDGVCVKLDMENKTASSKRDKPLYNFEQVFERGFLSSGYYEFFRKDWETTVSACRSHDTAIKIQDVELYSIFPHVDLRLRQCFLEDPDEKTLKGLLQEALDRGDEGLVLWPYWDCKSAKPIKVKDEITVDVKVTDLIEGTGKYKGMLGALMTNYGKVGTGFSDQDRKDYFDRSMIVGMIIEVKFMEWTKDNKFRHPRFVRVRWDKEEENLEQSE